MFIVGILLAVALLPRARRAVESRVVSAHQRDVTRSLADWEQEYARVQNKQDAVRAVAMLRYARAYYVPDDGYRGDPQTEAALESQRQRTMASIAHALEEYSGKDYGTSVEDWERWLSKQ
jgi:hypothetical protein